MDIQKEREAFEKEMLNSRYVAGNISAFWDKKTQDYDIAITELRMAWHAWQAAKAQAVPEGFEIGQLKDRITELLNERQDLYAQIEAQAVPETLKNDCMIGQTWFMKGSPTVALIKHAEEAYKAEVIAQNSKIEFGTDDNEHWFAHDVPFYGTVQIDRIEEHGLVEWDIHFNDCWQGPFNSKSECIKHLEECILEQRAEAQEQSHESK